MADYDRVLTDEIMAAILDASYRLSQFMPAMTIEESTEFQNKIMRRVAEGHVSLEEAVRELTGEFPDLIDPELRRQLRRAPMRRSDWMIFANMLAIKLKQLGLTNRQATVLKRVGAKLAASGVYASDEVEAFCVAIATLSVGSHEPMSIVTQRVLQGVFELDDELTAEMGDADRQAFMQRQPTGPRRSVDDPATLS